jgi:hypothetical protein
MLGLTKYTPIRFNISVRKIKIVHESEDLRRHFAEFVDLL